MKLSLTFTELSEYVKNHYGKILTFSKVNEKTVCLSYSQKMLFKTVQIPVEITIVDVNPDAITIGYKGGFGIDMIISGAISFLKAKVSELDNSLQTRDGHQVSLLLSQIKQTKALAEKLRITDILVHPDGLEITASLL